MLNAKLSRRYLRTTKTKTKVMPPPECEVVLLYTTDSDRPIIRFYEEGEYYALTDYLTNDEVFSIEKEVYKWGNFYPTYHADKILSKL